MPEFNFKVQVVTKIPTGRKSKYKIITKTENVHVNIEGVVYINMNGSYYVKCEYGEFPIHPDCFSVAGVKVVYPKRLLDGRRYLIRRDEYYGLPDINGYLPFSPGCKVKGNVVHNSIINLSFFKIKKVWEDDCDEECIAASRFYREHYNEIFKKK